MFILQLLNSGCTIPERLKGENDDIRWFSIAIIEQIYWVWFHFAVFICFTSLKEEEKISATNNGMKPYSWDEFLRLVRFKSKPNLLLPSFNLYVRVDMWIYLNDQGKENPSEISPPRPLDICTIMYTSGTSGTPKGVVLTQETITTFIRGVDIQMEQFEDKVNNYPYFLLTFKVVGIP